jgi:hypothetical protein
MSGTRVKQVESFLSGESIFPLLPDLKNGRSEKPACAAENFCLSLRILHYINTSYVNVKWFSDQNDSVNAAPGFDENPFMV